MTVVVPQTSFHDLIRLLRQQGPATAEQIKAALPQYSSANLDELLDWAAAGTNRVFTMSDGVYAVIERDHPIVVGSAEDLSGLDRQLIQAAADGRVARRDEYAFLLDGVEQEFLVCNAIRCLMGTDYGWLYVTDGDLVKPTAKAAEVLS